MQSTRWCRGIRPQSGTGATELAPHEDHNKRSPPGAREAVAKHPLSQFAFHHAAATENLELAALGHLHRALPNDGQELSPRWSANDPRDIARANRPTRLAAAEQRSNGSLDASYRRERSGRQPPGVPAFTESQLRIVHAAPRPSEFELAVCVPHRAASGHQLVDELLPEVCRYVGIGGPPAPTVDDDERVLRRVDGWWSLRFPHPDGCVPSARRSRCLRSRKMMVMGRAANQRGAAVGAASPRRAIEPPATSTRRAC